MDASELTRALIGVPAAACVPAFIPGSRQLPIRLLLTALFAAWALVPVITEWEAWVLAAAATGSSALLCTRIRQGRRLVIGGAAAVALMALTGAVLDSGASYDGLHAGISEDGAVLVLAGAFVAVFVGGAGIERLLAPFALKSAEGASDLDRAGRVIGWLERALLYGFVVGGSAGGAALVVAAKSLARLPSLSREDRFAEYFLIGTLSSVLVAVGLGVAVRAALGLTPVLS